MLSAHISTWVDVELGLLIEKELKYLKLLREAGIGGVSEADLEVHDQPEGGALRELTASATVDGPSETAEEPDCGPSSPCPDCVACEYECFLSTVVCTMPDGCLVHLCPMHGLTAPSYVSDKARAAAALPAAAKRVRIFRPVAWMSKLHNRVRARSASAAEWIALARRTLNITAPEDYGSAACDLNTDGSGVKHVQLGEAQRVLALGTALQMDDEHMLRLSTICTTGNAVSSRAIGLLSAVNRSKRGALPLLEACSKVVETAQGLPLDIEAVNGLRPFVEAGHRWLQRAEVALRGLAAEQTPLADDVGSASSSDGVGTRPPSSRPGASGDEIDALLAEADSIPLTLPLRAKLETVAAATRCELRLEQCLQPAEAVDALNISVISALVRDATSLSHHLSQWGKMALESLGNRHCEAVAWVDAAGVAIKRSTSLDTLKELHVQAAALTPLVSLPANLRSSVASRISAAETWLDQVQHLLSRADLSEEAASSGRAALVAVKGLLKVAEVDTLAATLSDALAKRDRWMDDCAALFAKPACQVNLPQLLTSHLTSHLTPSRATTENTEGSSVEASAWPPTDEENDTCCPCCTPEHPDVPTEVTWVGCDDCEAWFHSYCVCVPAALVETLESYRCPRCCVLSSTSYAFAPRVPPPILRTMRPSCAAVEALLTQACDASIVGPEVDAVRSLLARSTAWRRSLHADLAISHGAEGATSPLQREPRLAPSSQAMGMEELQYSAVRDLDVDILAHHIASGNMLEVVPPELKLLRFVATRRSIN